LNELLAAEEDVSEIKNDVLATELMPARDKDGWCQHPGIEQLLEDGDEDSELYIDGAKVAAAGYQYAFAYMTDELEEDHPAWVSYFENGEPACTQWEPNLPAGDGWRTVAIYDTDEGPAAMYVRELAHWDAERAANNK